MIAISVIVIAVSILSPVESVAPSTVQTMHLSATAPASNQAAAKLFSDLMDVDLRRSLTDSRPAVVVSNAASIDGTLGLRLTGTIIEPMHRYAVFTDVGGKSEIKSLGDKAGGADISDISADSVTLRIGDRSMVLHTIKPPAIGGLGL